MGLPYRNAQPVTAHSQVVGLGVHVDARKDVLADPLGNVLQEPVGGVASRELARPEEPGRTLPAGPGVGGGRTRTSFSLAAITASSSSYWS